MVSLITTTFPGDCTAWLDRLRGNFPAHQWELVAKACEVARQTYGDTRRKGGETYLEHALIAADLLVGLHLDSHTVAAALLHDVPAVAGAAAPDLGMVIHPAVARLVEGVQKMGRLHSLRGDHAGGEDSESLRKLLLTIEEDVRALLIKLAERVHDMRTLKYLDDGEERLRIARETMDLYAPLANRLGIGQIKWELEDLSFRFLEPETYKRIAGLLDERRVDREGYIAEVIRDLRQALRPVAPTAETSGRPKHIYSIWRKMTRKDVDFDRVYDVRAVRVLVDSLPQCYAALGVVHNLWKPIPGEFDDYISKPKNNMYQSLHTAVIGPGGKALEIQIRSFDMHRHAELGVAAHWRYKEGGNSDADFDRRIQSLREFLDLGDAADPGDFMERIEDALHYDKIHVFTPAGRVIDLPRGATPLDFAYHVHTEIGHRCRGAKVNGRIVPLIQQLENGQQVEILTAKQGNPSRDWLNPALGYLRTSRARAKVRGWFKHEHFEDNLERGKSLLDHELQRLGLIGLDRPKLARRFNFNQENDFLAALGRGDITLLQVVSAIQALTRPRKQPAHHPRPPSTVATEGGIRVQGVDNLLTHSAKCCTPVTGDPIVGHLTHAHGVVIHHRDCPNVVHCPRDRLLEADWGTEPDAVWKVRIGIQARDRQGLLRDVTRLVADNGINVVNLHTSTKEPDRSVEMALAVEVSDLAQISGLLARLESIGGVVQARLAPEADTAGSAVH